MSFVFSLSVLRSPFVFVVRRLPSTFVLLYPRRRLLSAFVVCLPQPSSTLFHYGDQVSLLQHMFNQISSLDSSKLVGSRGEAGPCNCIISLQMPLSILEGLDGNHILWKYAGDLVEGSTSVDTKILCFR